MAYTNPVMDILKSDTSAQSFNAASNMGANANRSFQQGASMALKMDQLLQEEENRLRNNAMQSQKVLQDSLTQQMNMQMKQQQLQFQKDQSAIQQNQFDKNYELKVEQQNNAKDIATFNARHMITADNNNVIKQVSDTYKSIAASLSKSSTDKTGGNSDIKRVLDSYQNLYKDYKKMSMLGTNQDTPMSRSIKNHMLELTRQLEAYSSNSSNPAVQQATKFANLLMNGIKSKDITLPGSDETIKQLYLDPNIFNDITGNIPSHTAPQKLDVPTETKQVNRL